MSDARVLTVLFTDVESSSRRWEESGRSFQTLLNRQFELMREGLTGGEEVKSLGDGLFLAFATPEAGLAFAIGAARRIHATKSLPARMGLHIGTVYEQTGPDGRPDYYGPAVNRAARICGVCPPGCVVVSDTVRALVMPRLESGVTLRDCGLVELRGVGPERLWQACHAELGDTMFDTVVGSPPTNLPEATTSFVGREAWLAQTVEALQGSRCVALVGPGGVGKSRLAREAALRLRETFPGGVAHIDVDGVSEEEVALARLAEALRPCGYAGRASLRDAAAFLGDRKVLLLLDGAEAFGGTRSMVEGLLSRASAVRLLITSRRQETLPGRTLVLNPMDPMEAMALLVERASAAGESLESDGQATELATRLEGLPLAIELAAARLTVMTPAQMLVRIDSSLEWLGDGEGRKDSLRATIRWSFDLLSDEGKKALLQCAVFPGAFGLETWERVAGGHAIGSLTELRRNSFVPTVGDGERRFGLREAVRLFARQRLKDDADLFRRTAERHADLFLERAERWLAQGRRAGEPEALSALEADAADLWAARENAQTLGLTQIAAALALNLGETLHLRGENRRAAALVRESKPANGPGLSGRRLRLLAAASLDTGDVSEGREAAEGAVDFYRSTGEPAGLARSLNLLGLACAAEGRRGDARAAYDEAFSVAAREGDREVLAMVSHNLGFLEFEESEPDLTAAERRWDEALAARRSLGDRRGVAETTTNLGLLRLAQGDRAAAWRFHSEALAAESAVRDLEGMGRSLFNLAEVAERSADAPTAARLYAAAASAFGATESPHRAAADEALRRFGVMGASLRNEASRVRPDGLVEWAALDAMPSPR